MVTVGISIEPALEKDQNFPLTSMQLGLLSETFIAEKPWVNVQQIVLYFDGVPFTSDAIGAGLDALANRHDALQIRIRLDDTGKLTQSVIPPEQILLEVLERPAASEEARLTQLETFLDADRAQGLALNGEVLWRATLIVWADAQSVLVLTLHHAIVDGRSMARMVRELLVFLHDGALPSAAADTISFGGFCEALPDAVHDAKEAETYFKTYLSDAETAGVLTLPSEGNADTTAVRKRQITRRMDVDQGAQMRDAAGRSGARMANLIQAAWGVLLSRWQGADIVTFGMVRSGRHAVPGSIDAVGCLINTLPACVRLAPERTVFQVMRELRKHTLSIRNLEQTPISVIRQSIKLHGATPLFETAVMFENAGIERLIIGDGPFPGVRKIELREEAGQPLMLSVYDEETVEIMLEYDPSRVPDEIANRMFAQLHALISQICDADDNTRVAELEMLEAGEKKTLLDWSTPDTVLKQTDKSLVEVFQAVVREAPDAIALEIIEKNEQMTFGELDIRSDRLARVLIEHGAASGGMVAINLPRSAEFIVAVLASLKTGAAFLPLDPLHPKAMRQHMLSESGARILIENGEVISGQKKSPIPQRTDLSADPVPLPAQHSDQLAYVIFTSGSTGLPKGVQVTQGNLLAHNAALTEAFEMKSEDRVLQFAGLSFDVAIEEIFTTLLSGATLVLRSDEMAESASDFLDQIEIRKLSFLNLPTAFWTILTQYMVAVGKTLPPDVRLVVVGGEAISTQALSKWLEVAPEARWMNGYGPTEATITCTLFEPGNPRADEGICIGRPTAHALAYVIASDGGLAPLGAVGELAIGGPAVARGYIGRPKETAKAFRTDDFAASGRLYCTGDRAQWQQDGNLRFLGRKDRQVKLRGYRIELGHVEKAVEECCPRSEVLCAVVDKDTPAAQLIAWVAALQAPDLNAASEGIAALLPSYMRPALMHVPEFPRTPNGKIDRSALPRPVVATASPKSEQSPSMELERQICEVMSKVLKLPTVMPDQSFYDLGGHSLLAVEFIGQIEIVTGKKLGIVDFRENPSARELSKVLNRGSHSSRHIIPIQPEGTKPPLFGIHILGASEDFFQPMAGYLGADQPIVGVSVGSLDENTPTGVEITASRYCEEINKFYPTGPINLMAVSLGSYFAFDLARQLQGSGREVQMLFLFDAGGPDGRTTVKGVRRLVALFRRFRYNGWGYPVRIARNLHLIIQNKVASYNLRRKTKGQGTEVPRTVFEFIASNEMAVNTYKPQRIDVPVTIFRAETAFSDSAETKENGLGWSSVVKRDITVIDVPGGHLSMLQEPHVPTLASRIQDVLDTL